jgi:imidazoleglycerol-phosphate dehydratase
MGLPSAIRARDVRAADLQEKPTKRAERESILRQGVSMTESRTATLERQTSESKVRVSLDLDGTGSAQISTGVGFFDHMLTAFAIHSLIDLEVESAGDWHIDAHHTVEDTAIVLGQAIRSALRDKSGIRRFGDALVPLDEALAQAVVDVSGRPYCVHTGEPVGQEYVLIGGFASDRGGPESAPYVGSLTRHVMETLAFHAQICLHLTLIAGRDPHHIIECQFKALARALREAIAFDPRVKGVPSTKGAL